MNNYELIKFRDNEFELDVNVSPEEDTVWLTKDQIAVLFERDRTVISRHINNIYKEKELDQKRKNFNTSAAKTLHEDKEDLTEPTDTSTKYYVNPAKEPIFTIIRHFTHYRFENALSAIWNRSFFAIFGAAILYTILTPISIFFKICDCTVNKHNYKYHWLATLNINLQNPKIIKPITWTIILYILTITKLITNITYIIFWIFKNLIVPFLIPNAIRSIKK